ncbi:MULTISPECIES: hypothetical protein [unclassified Lentimonas]|uniref:hypothetical protein n=1 Tax=unclassified Lentimonas TaxID=2630993 RepID=UPI001321A6A6|nr:MULTISPECIES: hypothetical protein [unclassified Lentimonas]CAA6676830.1 Unannotated [Lentimonas sp. CC4]CAA6686637.1 Unannotated [Lentimonas sp. CC6]CAA7075786.1 Unannotated [Lentimonas sp. CC4]CAA7168054.1 Unannotated [Lentimonas sp. CC21]CAA7183005.1 Unannotated [Lentimonas sp. CC8]
MNIIQKSVLVLLIVIGLKANACWTIPGPVSWDTSSHERYDIKKLNDEKIIEVYRKSELQEPISRFTIEGYSPIFSRFRVIEGGTKLVHLRGNHQVENLTDAAIEVYSPEQKLSTIEAGKLTDKIINRPSDYSTLSTDPRTFYSSGWIELDDSSIEFYNSIGDYVSVDLATLSIHKWLITKGHDEREDPDWNFENQLDDLKIQVRENAGRFEVLIWQPESLPYQIKWVNYTKTHHNKEIMRFVLGEDPYRHMPRRFSGKKNVTFFQMTVDPEIKGDDVLTLVTDLTNPLDGEHARHVFRISLKDFKKNSVTWKVAETALPSEER